MLCSSTGRCVDAEVPWKSILAWDVSGGLEQTLALSSPPFLFSLCLRLLFIAASAAEPSPFSPSKGTEEEEQRRVRGSRLTAAAETRGRTRGHPRDKAIIGFSSSVRCFFPGASYVIRSRRRKRLFTLTILRVASAGRNSPCSPVAGSAGRAGSAWLF